MTKKDARTQRAEELSGSRGGRGSRGHGRGAEGQRGRGKTSRSIPLLGTWVPLHRTPPRLRVIPSPRQSRKRRSRSGSVASEKGTLRTWAPHSLTCFTPLRASESRRIAPTRHFPLSASSWSHLLEEQANDNLDSIKRLRLYLKVFQGMVIDGISN